MENKRTTGKFVTNDIQAITDIKKEYAGKQVKKFITVMKEIGYTPDEIINIIKEQV